MATNILMPALSPTMTEGNLARWLKQEGDRIKAGDVIAEIETDKATMEVEAVDEGILGRILVPAGTQGVKVNDVIAVLVEAGEAVPAAGAAPKPRPLPRLHQPRLRLLRQCPPLLRQRPHPHRVIAFSRARLRGAWRHRLVWISAKSPVPAPMDGL